MRRIGVLVPGDESDPRANAAFTQSLAGLGWTDGRSTGRHCTSRAEGSPSLTAD
jgi:hypothetical protein